MTATREEADAASRDAIPPGDRSVLTGIRGLRWWATLLIALVLTVVGVVADLLRSGSLGLLFMIFFPVGCVLAIVWARRGEMFGPMVQPPLLLAVTVPLSVLVTGSLPRSGGLVSSVIAIAGPLINGFPAMAITTAVCLAIGFVRSRLQLLPGTDDEGWSGGGDRPAARTGKERDPADRGGAERPALNRPASGRDGERGGVTERGERGGGERGRDDRRTTDRLGSGRSSAGGTSGGGSRAPAPSGDRSRPRDDRPRDDRGRDDRGRDDRGRDDRPRDEMGRDEMAPGVYRVSSAGETERVARVRHPKPPR